MGAIRAEEEASKNFKDCLKAFAAVVLTLSFGITKVELSEATGVSTKGILKLSTASVSKGEGGD